MNNNIQDVNVELRVELGSVKKSVKDILQIGEGTILELDKNYNEPADIYVNNLKYAAGEIVAVDETYGIRITKIYNPDERKLNNNDV